MNKIKLFNIVAILMFFWGTTSLAATFVPDNVLQEDEWVGPRLFVNNLHSAGLDACQYLLGATQKYKDNSLITRRILLSFSETKCKNKRQIAKSYIGSSDPLVRATAIDLAASLNPNEKSAFNSEVLRLKDVDGDPAVQDSVRNFLAK